MYERFTDRARKVMQLANQEVRRCNHEYIDTEHILLGLLKVGPSVAINVLKSLDVDLRKVQLDVEALLPSSPDPVKGKFPQSPHAKKAIEYALDEARNLNHDYVGTEHLLLGLLREQEGAAAKLLMNQGLTLEEVQATVLNTLGQEDEFWNIYGPKPAPASANHPLHDRFTNRSRVVIQLARERARQLKHDHVGTGHILLGLVAHGLGVANDVLKNLRVELPAIRIAVEQAIASGPDRLTGRLPLTPRAEKVIEQAMEEACRLNHDYVGTEHLLLGLLREREGVAAQVLRSLGLTLEKVRAEIQNLLGHGE